MERSTPSPGPWVQVHLPLALRSTWRVAGDPSAWRSATPAPWPSSTAPRSSCAPWPVACDGTASRTTRMATGWRRAPAYPCRCHVVGADSTTASGAITVPAATSAPGGHSAALHGGRHGTGAHCAIVLRHPLPVVLRRRRSRPHRVLWRWTRREVRVVTRLRGKAVRRRLTAPAPPVEEPAPGAHTSLTTSMAPPGHVTSSAPKAASRLSLSTPTGAGQERGVGQAAHAGSRQPSSRSAT